MADNTTKEALKELLLDLLAPAKSDKPKGKAEYVITINGRVITTEIKDKEALDKTLRSIALEDARRCTTTEVIVYKLEGKADVSFESTVTVGSPVLATAEVGE